MVPLWCSRLRVWCFLCGSSSCCCSEGLILGSVQWVRGHWSQLQLRYDPWPRSFICCGCGQKTNGTEIFMPEKVCGQFWLSKTTSITPGQSSVYRLRTVMKNANSRWQVSPFYRHVAAKNKNQKTLREGINVCGFFHPFICIFLDIWPWLQKPGKGFSGMCNLKII